MRKAMQVMRRALRHMAMVAIMAGAVSVSIGIGPSVASAGTCPYGPCGGPASLTVTGVSQPPSGIVTLSVVGSGFGASEIVTFTVFSVGLSAGSATTTPTGTLDLTLVLPAGLAAGHHTLQGVGDVSGKIASAGFSLAGPSAPANPCPRTAAAVSPTSRHIVLDAAILTSPCLSDQAPSNAGSAGDSADGTGAAAAAAHSSSTLAFTGTDATATVGFAALVTATGGLLVLFARRRRANRWNQPPGTGAKG